MQNRNHKNFTFIKKGESIYKFIARLFMFVYVLIFAFFYNVYQLLTYQKGYHVLSGGDITFFTFAIGGSSLCLFLRSIIFIRIAQDIKNKVYKFIMMASQILCVVVFFICLSYLLYYTNGIVDWHYLGVYVPFAWALLCIVFLQGTTYLACASWMKFFADTDRIIRFCCVLCFIFGLIFTWVFCRGVILFIQMMK